MLAPAESLRGLGVIGGQLLEPTQKIPDDRRCELALVMRVLPGLRVGRPYRVGRSEQIRLRSAPCRTIRGCRVLAIP